MGAVMRRAFSSSPSLPRRPRGLRNGSAPEKAEFARNLRNNPTSAYDLLWQQLRKEQLGVKFRRRSLLLGWIPDFWCPAARVAVEIDYPSDEVRVDEHRRRDAILLRHAITVLRIPVDRIYQDAQQVAREVGLVVSGTHSPHNKPLQRSGTDKVLGRGRSSAARKTSPVRPRAEPPARGR